MEKYSKFKQELDGISPTDLDLYSGPRIPDIKPDNLKLFVVGDKIIQNGKPIRAIGVNDPNAIYSTLLTGQVNYRTQHKRMAELGIKFVRVYGMLYPVDYANNYFGTAEQKERFYKIVENYMDSAYDQGIGVMFSVLWNVWWIADYFGQSVSQLYGSGTGIPNSANINTIKQMIADIVNRFKNHPALAAWECSNELNQRATNRTLPTPKPEYGTSTSFTDPDDVVTQSMLVNILDMVSTVIAQNDTSGVLISTGNDSSGSQSSYEAGMGDYLYPFGGDEKTNIIELPVSYANAPPVNTISIHRYTNGIIGRSQFDTTDNLLHHRRRAKSYYLKNNSPKAFFIGEVGTPWWNDPSYFDVVYNNADDITVFKNACDAVLNSGCQLTFFWAWLETNFMVITSSGDANFAPNKALPIYDTKANLVKDLAEKLRMEEEYVDPFDLPIANPFILNQNGLLNTKDQSPKVIESILTSPSLMNHDNNQGITVEGWIYIDEVDNPPVADRVIVNLSDNSPTALLGFDAGVRLVMTRSDQPGGIRIRPYISIKDELNDEKKYIPGPTKSNPINLIQGWNHFCLQVTFVDTDPNWGIVYSWNGMIAQFDNTESMISRYSANTGSPSIAYNPSVGGKIILFGKEALTPAPSLDPVNNGYMYGGIANLRFYRRSLTDQEIHSIYLTGTPPRDYSLKTNSLDSVQSAEKLCFTFNNTYSSTDGNQVFQPIEYSSTPLCSLPGFGQVNQRIYWLDKTNI